MEEEANEKMNTIYSIVNALSSIYLDGRAFGDLLRVAFFIRLYCQEVEML
jgi:hypothetical protein